ncbi:prepilin peptidase [Pseudomonas sp. SID14000]|uniref:A24 family peptidase n=1 Tax=Pseudomonas sp. SID14000 TaxID=1986221 RepID=UPI000B3C8039|nr:prepilin peptidase [Pseudomonas sp. SID14000]
MSIEQMSTSIMLLVLLGIAVVSDLRCHRIPNLLIVVGLALGLISQVYASGVDGLGDAALATLIGFAVLLPMYALGGMAAGDVKLMAMVGSFLTPFTALWAVFFSLMAGALCGVLIVLFRGQLKQTLARYWLIASARAYLAPAANEVAGKPFPYSVAILLGTLASGYWLYIGR